MKQRSSQVFDLKSKSLKKSLMSLLVLMSILPSAAIQSAQTCTEIQSIYLLYSFAYAFRSDKLVVI